MDTPPDFRGAASRWAARVTSSRFAALVARAVLVAACVAVLAIIGYAADAGSRRALASSAPGATSGGATSDTRSAPPAAVATAAPSPAAQESAHSEPTTGAGAGPSSRGTASPEDPVVLNTATIDELRRLPGIGEKRAAAMIALRERLGRFRAVEDLLKVKGIGRAMLKRIRPLVRLDRRLDLKAIPDGGSS